MPSNTNPSESMARFTPALCEFLEGIGFSDIEIKVVGSGIRIIIPMDQNSAVENVIEMQKLALTECTNG